MICAAVAGSLWEYCALLTSFMPSAAAFLLKPAMRASTLETPGSVEMTRTLPLTPSFESASAACSPPSSLSVAMREAPIDLSVTVVSTSITLVPAFWMRLSGEAEALTSFGGTRSAAGLAEATASRSGFWSVASNLSGP